MVRKEILNGIAILVCASLLGCGGGGGGSQSPNILASISVNPANPSVPAGSTQQFAASGTYSDQTRHDITTQVTWSSSNTLVATVNSRGLAIAVNAGVATITATSGSISGSAAFAVTISPTWTGTKQLGTAADDIGYGVAVDNGGNVYVTGYTGGGLDGNTNAGGLDIFLLKYDSGGNKLWTRQLGTAADDISYGVAVDNSGNVYVTGYTGGGLDGNTNAGGLDIFLFKYDSGGNKLWTRQLGTASDDIGYGVAVDGSGNVYVTGSTRGGLDGNASAGFSDIFLVKFDAAGNKQWTRQLGTAFDDAGKGVAVDSGGNVYVTGFEGSGVGGPFNLFLAKYDAAGNKQWTQLDTTAPSGGNAVTADSSGNVYVTGYEYGGKGAAVIFLELAKYDAAGNKQWTQPNMTAASVGNGVAVDSGGNVYAAGYTSGGLDGNINAGGLDIFLIKYDSNGNKQ